MFGSYMKQCTEVLTGSPPIVYPHENSKFENLQFAGYMKSCFRLDLNQEMNGNN